MLQWFFYNKTDLFYIGFWQFWFVGNSSLYFFFFLKAYVFMDLNANEDADLPKELTEKYTLTKVLGR